MLRFAAAVLVASCSHAWQPDTIVAAESPPVECPYGCARWSNLAADYNTANQTAVNALWASAPTQSAAGSACAIPAGLDVPMGAACYCKGTAAAPTAAWGWCTDPAVPTPQQVNLQFGANASQLQVAFVTVDRGAALIAPPLVQICGPALQQQCVNVTGHTNRAPEPQEPDRILSYSFVPLPPLQPATRYTYRCLPSAAGGVWSQWLNTTTPPAAGMGAPVRMLANGDQGLYPYSSVGNMLEDRAAGRIDYFLHLGDFAYNMAMANGSRGDSYFNALQPLISDVPLIPVIGNHELEGSPFGVYCNETTFCEGRYLNQTAGYLLTGAASGTGTNYYYSLDIGGLVHLIVLDSMPYLSLGEDLRDAQNAWLAADLARAADPAQRALVPWIVVATHVQMYSSSNSVYARDTRLASATADMRADWEPLLMSAGVDLVLYGHTHSYESMWPVVNGSSPVKSFDAPRAPVHVLTGAAGPPGVPDGYGPLADYDRKVLSAWSYGILEVHNATHLTWSHFFNNNGSLFDTWTVYQPSHGPFLRTDSAS